MWTIGACNHKKDNADFSVFYVKRVRLKNILSGIKLILCVVLSVYSCLTGVLNLKPGKMEEKEKEFAQIVREHKRRIYTVCYMFSKDADEVADLFQEILINMWKGFSSFRSESSISTWIWRISLNTCINTGKRRKLETIPLDVNINPYEDVDEEGLQVRQLYDRINRLGLVDRSIILMWLENLSYEEIGEILGISVKNVSVKLVRIREKLRQMSKSN